MTINSKTKISAIIKANKDSIEVLASLAKPLEKLRNPILRAVMAGRVTVSEAAKMGECPVEDFKAALAPLGFTWEQCNEASAEDDQGKPAWLPAPRSSGIFYFDVRDILAAGDDPLKDIIMKYKAIEEGSVLCITNTFIPFPLIQLLEKQGSKSFTETVDKQEYRSYFLKTGKQGGDPGPGGANISRNDKQAFDSACSRFDGDNMVHIDVRSYEMPVPMQMILASLQQLQQGQALFVYHKRVPVYLLEELADKHYSIHIRDVSATEVHLLIYKS